MLDYEEQYFAQGYHLIAGCDEAGRGCLLGPVVAGAVILPEGFHSDLINDSKKLSEKQREEAYELIKANAVSWAVAEVSAEDIDKMNILVASRYAMFLALQKLTVKPELILTDAMKMEGVDVPVDDIIHGDAKAECIAAASIMAKVTRDHICYELDKQYPEYHIARHKGYGTKDHLAMLEKYGPIPKLYRYTYGPVQKIEKIKLF